jgi:hypothetical protein
LIQWGDEEYQEAEVEVEADEDYQKVDEEYQEVEVEGYL